MPWPRLVLDDQVLGDLHDDAVGGDLGPVEEVGERTPPAQAVELHEQMVGPGRFEEGVRRLEARAPPTPREGLVCGAQIGRRVGDGAPALAVEQQQEAQSRGQSRQRVS